VKVLIAVHGYPPELVGGTELWAQDSARGLAQRGHGVRVVSGSLRGSGGLRVEREAAGPDGVEAVRFLRGDLYFDHWQKSNSVEVARAFAQELSAFEPDVVHVMHWLRLSDDLVRVAARAGIPAVVSLQDRFVDCLLAFRVDPRTQSLCAAPYAPLGCVTCAQHVPPRTPWIPREQQFLLFGQRDQALRAELRSAAAVTVPHASLGEELTPLLEGAGVAWRTLAPPPIELDCSSPRGSDHLESSALRVGVWGGLSALKGTDLILEALQRLEDPRRVEVRFAGTCADPALEREYRQRARGLRVEFLGPYERRALAQHSVVDVNVMVSGSRAPETYGFVLDEARALGLPAVLPRAGAFAERGSLEQGVLHYASGSSEELALVLSRLRYERGLLETLRAAARRAQADAAQRRRQRDALGELELLYDGALQRGVAASEESAPAWFEERMRTAEREAWDAACSRTPPSELGFSESVS